MFAWWRRVRWLRKSIRNGTFHGKRADGTLDAIVRESGPSLSGEDPSVAPLVIALVRALISYGLPVHRVKEAVGRLSGALKTPLAIYVTPTGAFLTVGQEDDEHTFVIEAEPGLVDLESLCALHGLIGRVERGEVGAADAARRIDRILGRVPRYGSVIRIPAYGLASAAAAILLGGGVEDVPTAAGLGVLVGLLERFSSRWAALGRLLPIVAASLVATAAAVISRLGFPVEESVVLVSALISLLPGLSLTMAITELATANLVSGTARLTGAMMTFLQLGFGIALAHEVVVPHLPAPPAQLPASLPSLFGLLVPVLAAAGFVVLLRIRPRDSGWIIAICVLSAGASQLGAVFGPEVGAFVSAIAVGVGSHLFARWRDQPVALLLIPGTLLLVPGSLGFVALSSLLTAEPVAALNTGFQALMIAVAISAGLLVATLALPPGRAL